MRASRPLRRAATIASPATRGHPMPMSNRLLPVMFAMAYGACAGLWPALYEKYRSTAYSGRTATSASAAVAKLAETSTWNASAAQERRNAAATTAAPYKPIEASGPRFTAPSLKKIAGRPTAKTRKSFHHPRRTIALLRNLSGQMPPLLASHRCLWDGSARKDSSCSGESPDGGQERDAPPTRGRRRRVPQQAPRGALDWGPAAARCRPLH